MPFDFICLEGNIGIGKTTLVKKLAQHYHTVSFFEEFNQNPWLPLFYDNPKDTALALELSFLNDRCKQLLQVAKENPSHKLISDYCLDKCLLFARANLSDEDFETYKKLYHRISKTIIQPSLVIVLHTSVNMLLQNIKQRGRSYEQNIQPAYLQTLNEAYTAFFSQERAYTVLNIFAENINVNVYEEIFRQVVSFISLTTPPKTHTIRL